VALADSSENGLDFKKVIAFDQSAAQLKHAQPQAKVEYLQGDAYNIPCESSAADLVAVAQAAHWFRMQEFLGSVHRVLRPGGTFALAGYGVCRINHEPAQYVFEKYYASLGSHLEPGTPGCYWDCDRRLLDTGHANLRFPKHMFSEEVRLMFEEHRELTLEEFEGYLLTWSAYRTHKVQHAEQPDIVASVVQQLRAIVTSTLKVSFPFFLVLTRKI
jgi:SAM-dependent methyltransferase